MSKIDELSLDLLEIRLKLVEDKLFGQNKSRPSQTVNILNQLSQIDAKLKQITTGKERFNLCHQKLMEMKKWLDPDYIESVTASTDSKLEEIFVREDDIKRQAQQLQRIAVLEKNLDSPQIRECHGLRPQLDKIQTITLQQHEDNDKLSEETKQLLIEYNNWIVDVKNKLATWHETIRTVEKSKHQKKKGSLQLEFD